MVNNVIPENAKLEWPDGNDFRASSES
jgi:hypothetical protein